MKPFSCQVGTFAQFSFILVAALIHSSLTNSLCLHLFLLSRSHVRPSLVSAHVCCSGPAGGSPKGCPCSPMGPWLYGETTALPAGRSTPATARPTATRPTECQTGSGEGEGENDIVVFTTVVRTGREDGSDKRGPRWVHQQC